MDIEIEKALEELRLNLDWWRGMCSLHPQLGGFDSNPLIRAAQKLVIAIDKLK